VVEFLVLDLQEQALLLLLELLWDLVLLLLLVLFREQQFFEYLLLVLLVLLDVLFSVNFSFPSSVLATTLPARSIHPPCPSPFNPSFFACIAACD
jgi:hypothetical protein